MTRPSLTTHEDAFRANQQKRPKFPDPKNELAAQITDFVLPHLGRCMDQGHDIETTCSILSTGIASIVSSMAASICASVGEEHNNELRDSLIMSVLGPAYAMASKTQTIARTETKAPNVRAYRA